MASVRDLLHDLGRAVRSLLHSPAHAAVVVATLAVGVGGATAVVAVGREALLRPLPLREPERLVRVWDRGASGMEAALSPPVWQALRARTDVFETVGGSVDSMYTLTGRGEPESLVGYRFSADFFPMLGREPLLGRVFVAGEDRTGAERVVVLSHRLWSPKFGNDPAVVGRAITLSGHSWTVIGVMPAGFVHPIGIELWTPFDLPEASRDDPRARFVRVVARLRPGRTMSDARRAVADVQKQLEAARSDALRGGGLVVPGSEREVEVQWIGLGYLDAMRIPLLAGRDVGERDREGSPPVVLVNAAFVRRFLEGSAAAALGRRLAYRLPLPPGEEPPLREIVGVIGDVKHLGFDREPDPAVYVPFAQQPIPEDPEQPVAYLMPLAELAGESLALRRLSALLAGAFALVALGLAALGTYGVVAQVVGSGTREIGVRLALGASASSVVRGVLRDALSAAGVGALAGLVVAAGVGRLLRSLLVGVAPLDPLTLAGAALVDPAAVLRQE